MIVRWVLLWLALAGPALAQGRTEVVVNGIALDRATVTRLTQQFGPVPPGRYWYDPVSGLWGYSGGPMMGQMLPGLSLGGPLRPEASGGGDGRLTGLFINGRELHPMELQFLIALYGSVVPGRYWLLPNGIGGVEGGPPLFNLSQRTQQVYGGGGTGSHYMPGIGGRPGIGVGRASDGCVYMSYGGYSAESC